MTARLSPLQRQVLANLDRDLPRLVQVYGAERSRRPAKYDVAIAESQGNTYWKIVRPWRRRLGWLA